MAITYTWKKYTVKTTTTINSYTDKSQGTVTLTSSKTSGIAYHNKYNFDETTGIYTIPSIANTSADMLRKGDCFINLERTARTGDTVYVIKTCSTTSGTTTLTCTKRSAQANTTTAESQGTYISDVTSTSSSAYPTKGKHTDGYWYVYQGNDNVAPTTPGKPTFTSEIKGGDSITVTWTASTDENSNLSGYQLYVSLSGGSWTSVYIGSSTSVSYTVPEGTETIAFLVRAYDALSAYSSYATSTTVTVSNGGISGYVNINGTNKELTGEGYVTIGGVQKEIVGAYVNIGGVWKESF